jgi:hypothetical protein
VIVAGHQRVVLWNGVAMSLLMFTNRELTELEFKEYNIRSMFPLGTGILISE